MTVKVLHVDREAQKVSLSRKECLPRVFRKSAEDIEAERSAAEVAEWMKGSAERNANVGSMANAFNGIRI